MKKAISILTLIVIIFCFSSCAVDKTKTSNLDEYNEYLSRVQRAESYMPSIEKCGNYTSIIATYRRELLLLFEVYTVGLFLSYDEDEYKTQKDFIINNYEFFTANDEDLESDCDAVIDSYNIQLAKFDYELDTRKMGLLIGIDDTNNKICYLYYYDFDLDVLDDLDEYIEDFFYFPN